MGYYYYDQEATTSRDIHIGSAAIALGLTPGAAVFNRGRVRTESHALFANASYAFSDRLELGLGARYTDETKDADWRIDGRNSGIFAIATDQVRDSRSDSHLSASASLRYFPNQRQNLYLRYASGFKSGGYNLDFVTAADVASGLEFDKETVDSLEAGLKSQLWNGKVRLNLAAFIAEYDDYQVNQFVDLGGGGTSISIRNAAQVTTRGLEAEIGYRPTARLEVNAALGLLDTRFDRFPGGGALGADVSGNELVNAPDLSFSLTASYRHPLRALAATLLVRGELSHSAGYFTTADNVKSQQLLLGDTVPFGYIPDQTLVNARIGLISSGSGWEVYLWGRNLTDQRQATESERDFFGTVTAMPSVPRTFGLELLWRYQP